MFIRDVSEKPAAALDVVGIPGAGGSLREFRVWDEPLGPRLALRVVDPWALHFASEREGVSDIGGVARLLAPELLACGRRVVLVGHSRGSLVAYELARSLVEAGRDNLLHGLVAMAHCAPSEPPLHPLDVSDPEVLRGFLEEMGVAPPEVMRDAELLDLLLSRMAVELGHSENYKDTWPQPLPGRVHVYWGRDDAHVLPETLDAWRASAAECAFREFAGGHFFPFQESRDAVVRALRADFGADGGTYDNEDD
jgi:surfactin synthase thioesterase subunit